MKKIFGAIGRYFKGVKKEISRIRWTNKNDMVKYTVATMVFLLFFGVFFWGIDMIISLLRSWM